MTRLGLPQSDDTILRNLKRHAADRREGATVRVVGIDDWSWRKMERSWSIWSGARLSTCCLSCESFNLI